VMLIGLDGRFLSLSLSATCILECKVVWSGSFKSC
jgi:hypothetical protein